MVIVARLKTRSLDGVDFLNDDVEIGREYYLVASQTRRLDWIHQVHGYMRTLACAPDAVVGGFLPLELFERTDEIDALINRHAPVAQQDRAPVS